MAVTVAPGIGVLPDFTTPVIGNVGAAGGFWANEVVTSRSRSPTCRRAAIDGLDVEKSPKELARRLRRVHPGDIARTINTFNTAEAIQGVKTRSTTVKFRKPKPTTAKGSRLMALLFRLFDCLAEFFDCFDSRGIQRVFRYIPPERRRIQRVLLSAHVNLKIIFGRSYLIGDLRSSVSHTSGHGLA